MTWTTTNNCVIATMQTPAELCPNVFATKDRNVFLVESRSEPGVRRRVDAEARFGLGSCNCLNFTKGNNWNCYHILQVRKFVMCVAMQAAVKGN